MKHRKGSKSQGQGAPKLAAKSVSLPAHATDTLAHGHKAGDEPKVTSAFDLWLERGLHTLFDEVANEPIPPELLQLIEDDRRRVEDDKIK